MGYQTHVPFQNDSPQRAHIAATDYFEGTCTKAAAAHAAAAAIACTKKQVLPPPPRLWLPNLKLCTCLAIRGMYSCYI